MKTIKNHTNEPFPLSPYYSAHLFPNKPSTNGKEKFILHITSTSMYTYIERYLSVESIWISFSKNSLNIWGHVEERWTCSRVRNSCIACVAVGPTWGESKTKKPQS